MNEPLIEIRDVSIVRETTLILDGISISIPRFRHTAILGPNGSGKSSLTKLLMRHFYPSVMQGGHQGTVSILGRSDWEVSQLWRRMGMVTPSLDRDFGDQRTGRMTVAQAVASGYNATLLGEWGPSVTEEMSHRIAEVIELVGMTSLCDRKMRTLSTGERRRTMIARAIVHKPDIFVMDEPTSGLDLVAKSEFIQILDALLANSDTTVVLVTHHVDEIPPRMDHVIMLDRGTVSYDGSKSLGLTRQRLSSLYRSAIDVRCDCDGWYHANLCEG